MAAQPPVQPGQVSPDGMWRWDGARWVPTTAPGAPRRSREWIWCLAGGGAVLLVLGLVGAGVGAYNLFSSFQHGGFTCLPSDLPGYPGATVASEQTYVGTNVQPCDSKACRVILDSNDDSGTSAACHHKHLRS